LSSLPAALRELDDFDYPGFYLLIVIKDCSEECDRRAGFRSLSFPHHDFFFSFREVAGFDAINARFFLFMFHSLYISQIAEVTVQAVMMLHSQTL